jgi:tetratricopeptide (TPR) repeat protein
MPAPQVSNTWSALSSSQIEVKEGFGLLVRRVQDTNSGNFFNHVLGGSIEPETSGRSVPSDWHYHRKEAVEAVKFGDLIKAEQSWLMAFEIAREFDKKDPRLAYTLDNLASVCFAAGRYNEAEIHCRSAYEAIEAAHGKDHLSRTNCLNNLAGVYYCQGRFSVAEQLCVQVLSQYYKALGPDHEFIGLAANNLAMVYHAQAKFSLAEMMYERALPIRKAALGQSDPKVLTMLHNYANVLDELGRVDQSKAIRMTLSENKVWQLFHHDDVEKLTA